MRNHIRLLTAALTTALLLALGGGAAQAARNFTATNNALLTYIGPDLVFHGNEGTDVICDVTLTASLHATAGKTRGSLLGFVNGGRALNCSNSTGGETRAIALVSHRFPWHITLESFEGTLPRIREILILINNTQFLFQIIDPVFRTRIGCLYRGTVGTQTRGRTGAAEYTVELLEPQVGNTVPLFEDRLDTSGFADCPESGELDGIFHATLPPIIRLV